MNDLQAKEKLAQYLTDDLYENYWQAVEHFKSRDLVLFIDSNEDLMIFDRKELLADESFPEFVKAKIADPALGTGAGVIFGAAFWLIIELEEGLAVSSITAGRTSQVVGSA